MWKHWDEKIEKEQRSLVVKSNDLIRHSRNALSLQLFKTLHYMISKINKNDEPSKEYIIDIQTFCKVANINDESGKNYNSIKEALSNIDRMSVWVELLYDGIEKRVRWFDTLEINKQSGVIKYSFDKSIQPLLFNLDGNFTSYMLSNIITLKSRYAIQLYEMLKSYVGYKKSIKVSKKGLLDRLNAGNYKTTKDIKERILEHAKKEINDKTDIQITYSLTNEYGGRGYDTVSFFVRAKDNYEIEATNDKLFPELGYNWIDER